MFRTFLWKSGVDALKKKTFMNELWSCLGSQHTVNLHSATSSFHLNLPCIHLRIMRPSLHTLFFFRLGSSNRGTLQNHHEEARFTEDARQQQFTFL